MRRFATVLPVLLLFALLAPAGAHARVVLVATGDGTATLTDVATNQVVARVPVGGRTRAAVAAPDGSRGHVAAGARPAAGRAPPAPDGSRGSVAGGARVVGIDLATRLPVGEAALPGTPTALAVSADGLRLYAARPGALDVIDAPTFAVRGSIRLPRDSKPTSLAVSSDGARA